MLNFLDGPAAPGGNGLCIRRAPLFLRIVVNGKGEFDALDQLHDVPEIGEAVYAYRKVEDRGHIHINRRDKQGRHAGGYFVMATYQFVEPQPDAETLTSNMRWAEWARQQAAKGVTEQ